MSELGVIGGHCGTGPEWPVHPGKRTSAVTLKMSGGRLKDTASDLELSPR
jgi:hypothetical protein